MAEGGQIMKTGFSRRKLIQAAGAAAIPFPAAASTMRSGPRYEGADTPKICLEIGVSRLAAGSPDDTGARRIKQLGVDHVIARYPGPIPWEEDRLRELIDRWKRQGLTVGNIMIGGFPNVLYGR